MRQRVYRSEHDASIWSDHGAGDQSDHIKPLTSAQRTVAQAARNDHQVLSQVRKPMDGSVQFQIAFSSLPAVLQPVIWRRQMRDAGGHVILAGLKSSKLIEIFLPMALAALAFQSREPEPCRFGRAGRSSRTSKRHGLDKADVPGR